MSRIMQAGAALSQHQSQAHVDICIVSYVTYAIEWFSSLVSLQPLMGESHDDISV